MEKLITKSRFKAAIADINSVMNLVRHDTGKSWPLRSDYLGRDALIRELMNIAYGRYRIISEDELVNKKLAWTDSNLSKSTWNVLLAIPKGEASGLPPRWLNRTPEYQKIYVARKIEIASMRATGEY